ncbi:conserved hypothetical protein [Theileria equi strain WA]|uniref:G domain-containing protein n=1 Tax=Theileria equi strain WA TaxID=1537102 RepID=L1LEQ0_THEEQ|nr:conserved hypothetical protein [Theileria equi strain WA]EKX73744.1 conserved hypothetical protein [Theileria equi strain WA]|eukprot:XP_004833196.1 conserved hypothetical protein [Theileria equi strain WA]
MGGGKSQKGGKHGSIGRTLAHDILLRQFQQNEELRKNILKKKEHSVYERSNLDEFTLAASQGLESYISQHGNTREVLSSDLNTQLSDMINFPHLYDCSLFPTIPIPRRCFFFSEEQKILISKLSKQRHREEINSRKKAYRRKNKKLVDMYMHGDRPKPMHGIYSDKNTNVILPNGHNSGSNVKSKASKDSESFYDSEYSLDDDEEEEEEQVLDEDEDEKSEEDYEDVEETEEEEDDDEEGVDSLGDSKSHKDVYVKQYQKYLKEESENMDLHKIDVEELEKLETRNFYTWRKLLLDIEQKEKCVITPYEKNIEFWRQLWRVIERSHLIFVIIESRDPLFFRVPDLENYVKEVDPRKKVLLILNKADFLSPEIRREWADYFRKADIDFVFFSSILDAEMSNESTSNGSLDKENVDVDKVLTASKPEEDLDIQIYTVDMLLNRVLEYKKIQTKDYPELDNDEIPIYTVGCVGFPNVGKSSLINCLMNATKTNVSSQPGKTKHMQTLILRHLNITLCDCPGLIFPTMVSTKYHLLINNIASTSHFRGNMTLAVQLVCNRIPDQLCKRYDVPLADCIIEANDRKILFSYKFLEYLCKNRNFISGGKGGQLDYGRAAKLVLNDYTSGNLLFCSLPPGSENSAGDSIIQSMENLSIGNMNSDNRLEIYQTTTHGLSSEVRVNIDTKTVKDIRDDESKMQQWLIEFNKEDQKINEKPMTKRKMRFLIKGKRRVNTTKS